MHPREGWPADGSRPPGFPFHRKLTRRNFLRGVAAAGLLAAGAGPLLSGCASDLSGNVKVPLPRPYNPVTWPIFSDNKPIKSGLAPEKGATLKIYNWVAYVNQ